MPPSPCLAFASPSHQAAAPPTQRPTSSCSEPLSPWPSPFSTYDAGPKSLLYASPTSPSAPAYNLPASRSADKKTTRSAKAPYPACLPCQDGGYTAGPPCSKNGSTYAPPSPTHSTTSPASPRHRPPLPPPLLTPCSSHCQAPVGGSRFPPKPSAASTRVASPRPPYNRIPSPRKGGTQWYAALGTPRAVTQAQGAWKTPAVVDSIYDGPEEAGRLREIVLAASRGPDALALQDALVALQSDAASIHTTDRDGADSFSSQLVHKLHTLRHLFSEDAVSTFAPDSASRIRRLKKHAPDDDKALLVDIASAFTLLTKRGHHAVATATGKATLPAPLLSAPARPYSRSRRLHQKTHCPR